MQAMTLIRKDIGVYRMTIVGGAMLTLVPYVSSVLLQYFYPASNGQQTLHAYRSILASASVLGVAVMVAMAAVFGGVAFASERRERSAEFLALLPVRRRAVVFSKLVVAFVGMAVMLGFHVAVMKFASPSSDVSDRFAGLAGVSLMSFGAAWLCSTFLRSAGLSAGIAIAFTVTTIFLVTYVGEGLISSSLVQRRYAQDWWKFHNEAHRVLDMVTNLLPFVAGGFFLLAGSIYYSRRVAP